MPTTTVSQRSAETGAQRRVRRTGGVSFSYALFISPPSASRPEPWRRTDACYIRGDSPYGTGADSIHFARSAVRPGLFPLVLSTFWCTPLLLPLATRYGCRSRRREGRTTVHFSAQNETSTPGRVPQAHYSSDPQQPVRRDSVFLLRLVRLFSSPGPLLMPGAAAGWIRTSFLSCIEVCSTIDTSCTDRRRRRLRSTSTDCPC